MRKLSSFFFSAPRSKHEPHVSRRVQTRRTRKQSSGESIGDGASGHGRPSAVTARVSTRSNQRARGERTVAEGDERPECVKDDSRVDDTVVVQLAEVLDRRDSLLVVLEAVRLCVHEGSASTTSDRAQAYERTSMPIRMFSRTSSITLTAKSGWYRLRSYRRTANRCTLLYLIFHTLVNALWSFLITCVCGRG